MGAVSGGLSVPHLGALFPGIEVRVSDKETGEEGLGPREEGEICIRPEKSRFLALITLKRRFS